MDMPAPLPADKKLDTDTVRQIVKDETLDLRAQISQVVDDVHTLAKQVGELTTSFKQWRDTVGTLVSQQSDQIDKVAGLVEKNANAIDGQARNIKDMRGQWDIVIQSINNFYEAAKVSRNEQSELLRTSVKRIENNDKRIDDLSEMMAYRKSIIEGNQKALAELPGTIEKWIFGTEENGKPSIWRQLQGHSARLDDKIDSAVDTIQKRLNEVATDINIMQATITANTQFRERLTSLGTFISSSAKQGRGYLKANWKTILIQGLLKVVLPGGAIAGAIKVLEVLVN